MRPSLRGLMPFFLHSLMCSHCFSAFSMSLSICCAATVVRILETICDLTTSVSLKMSPNFLRCSTVFMNTSLLWSMSFSSSLHSLKSFNLLISPSPISCGFPNRPTTNFRQASASISASRCFCSFSPSDPFIIWARRVLSVTVLHISM